MSDWQVVDTKKGNTRDVDSKSEAEETKDDLIQLGADPRHVEIRPPGDEKVHTVEDGEAIQQGGSVDSDASADGGTEVVEEPEPVTPEEHQSAKAEVVAPEELSKDPIGFLERINNDFVNTIKGKPAISKQGFRFIQREFEISTESEVVQWIDDPLGCVVWAKAELPGGYSAEAHGEGYQFESDVSDNEFVRYADTRAKNRAISDLTSAGALAVSELGE